MKQSTKDLLYEAKIYCRDTNRSLEFTIQYLQDFAEVNLDCVLKFLGIEELNKEKR